MSSTLTTNTSPGRFRLFIGFTIVILIWSTTPLAVKWSAEGTGFIFGVSARMVIGMLVLIVLAFIKRVPIPLHKEAVLTYLAAGAATGISPGVPAERRGRAHSSRPLRGARAGQPVRAGRQAAKRSA